MKICNPILHNIVEPKKKHTHTQNQTNKQI
jgi:hypothetical protein